jgi:hypothetical protein
MTRHNKLTNDSAWKVPHKREQHGETFDVCCLLSWQGKFKLSVAIMGIVLPKEKALCKPPRKTRSTFQLLGVKDIIDICF